MNEEQKNVLNSLQKNVEIPDIVQRKAEQAFAAIHQESGGQEISEIRAVTRKKGRGMPKKRLWILAAAVVLVIGSISVGAAAYMQWSRGLEEGLQATKEQQQKLEDNQGAAPINLVSEDQGIKVTAVQTIADSYYVHIAFKVEGFEVPEGMDPSFGDIQVILDGKTGDAMTEEDYFSWGGSFYNGIIGGPDGKIIYADGTPMAYTPEGGLISKYTAEDGSLEFDITLANSEKREFFLNKKIRVELRNIGTVDKAEHTTLTEGVWDFEWTLQGSNGARSFDLNTPLNEDVTVVEAEISPISIRAVYNAPRKALPDPETGYDEEGNEIPITVYEEPPALSGVKMKDGTLYPFLYAGPGTSGYRGEDSEEYLNAFAIDRILDTEDVEALLFVKSYAEEGETPTEDNFYVVPLE